MALSIDEIKNILEPWYVASKPWNNRTTSMVYIDAPQSIVHYTAWDGNDVVAVGYITELQYNSDCAAIRISRYTGIVSYDADFEGGVWAYIHDSFEKKAEIHNIIFDD